MKFREFECLSPNRDPREHEGLGVVFHHSELDFKATIERMLDPGSRVSYHCLIGSDGVRCALVPDREIAWHSGVSVFRGRERCNEFLLGVAFEGDTYETRLTSQQIDSALEWLSSRWGPRGWDVEKMTDHRQVSPGRKSDLNPEEWHRFLDAMTRRFAPKTPAARVSGLKLDPPRRT